MNTVWSQPALGLGVAIVLAFAPRMAIAKEGNNCAKFSEDAALLMAARQSEFPLGKLIEHARGTPHEDLLIDMIEAAYRQPVLTTKEEQDQAIAGFRLSAEIACLRATGEKGS